MKLYLISQSVNNDYDTYDSAVVAAPDAETARLMNPRGRDFGDVEWGNKYNEWALTPEQVEVELIGEAREGETQRVICASFNAG